MKNFFPRGNYLWIYGVHNFGQMFTPRFFRKKLRSCLYKSWKELNITKINFTKQILSFLVSVDSFLKNFWHVFFYFSIWCSVRNFSPFPYFSNILYNTCKPPKNPHSATGRLLTTHIFTRIFWKWFTIFKNRFLHLLGK